MKLVAKYGDGFTGDLGDTRILTCFSAQKQGTNRDYTMVAHSEHAFDHLTPKVATNMTSDPIDSADFAMIEIAAFFLEVQTLNCERKIC